MLKRTVIFKYFFLLLCLHVEGFTLNLWTKARFRNVEILKHFWKSTGLSPASEPKLRTNFLLSDDEKLNLDYIGALPNQGIRLVRIHYILDLVTVSNVESEEPIFYFGNLDRLINRLYSNGLYPDFELMGNPSNYFRDFRVQSKHWISLIEQIIRRYSELYGADYVHGWTFELMNEPDLKQYDFFNATLEQYRDYFLASQEAVPRLSGPAGLFRNNKKAHSLCWSFLDYCNLNPCNLNMITFHRKGNEVGSKVVTEGLDLINTLISDYPNLKDIKFGNDEADIMTGWYKPREWRADVRYAALVVQVIIGHIEEMLVKRNIPFEMLSNDNAFLSFSPHYFTQRTLLARFQMNDTRPPHLQFFRKPIYTVMGILSLLGDYLKDIRYHPGEKGFSYLMTSYKYQDTFLAVITDDRVTNETYTVSDATYVDFNVKIALGNLTLSGVYAGYIMNNDKSNPYQVWKDGGSPDFPNADLRRKMREAEGFEMLFLHKVKPHQSQIKFILRNVLVPSIVTVNICFEGTNEPGQVTDLHYVNITHNEIILFWKDTLVNSRCILSYVVEFKKEGDTDFHRINLKDSIFLSYHHDGTGKNGNDISSKIGVLGEYRVVAVDYWNRYGLFSDVLQVSG